MFHINKLPTSTDAQYNSIFIRETSSKYIKILKNNKEYGPFKTRSSPSMGANELGLGLYHREALQVVFNEVVQVRCMDEAASSPMELDDMAFIIEPLGSNKTITVDEVMLGDIKREFANVPMIAGWAYSFRNKYKLVPEFTTGCLSPSGQGLTAVIGTEDAVYCMGENTNVHFATKPTFTLNIDLPNETNRVFKSNFNFVEIGIGGLDKQFEVIFRRAFASRLLPKKIIKDLGINHVRGIMLHGPPGTGKTLIARQIGKILNCKEPKIVNGPSLLNKYVGESEENVRKLFADAMNDTSENGLHLIICDEFDALARKRGTGSSDMNDKIVNQFLTMIDGPQSLNNVLLICMTNRLDLIDEAMLRPGRLELQIEISLPDEAGRLQILKIHTKRMHELGYLDDVDLTHIAGITKNFTGAELEAVVKNAVSYSVSKEVDPDDLSSVSKIRPLLNQSDFLKSCKEIKPQFGGLSEQIERITAKPFELYSKGYSQAYEDMCEKITTLASGNLLSCLVTGWHYVGKTTLACQVAKSCGYSCVKFVNSETLMTAHFKDMALFDAFKSGCNSDSLILILDCVERLIEYSRVLQSCTYNNQVLQTIFTILDTIVESDKKIVVLLTSSKLGLMENFGLDKLCTYKYELDDDKQAQIFKKMKNRVS